jgi:hypothetical protein
MSFMRTVINGTIQAHVDQLKWPFHGALGDAERSLSYHSLAEAKLENESHRRKRLVEPA